ncbi:hypothetical protein [Sandarakinorhabdus sp.]|uniref:hypothetical protein n=1 Tax=Sandarakinorhabdus sp. TaxID=1916663 RepID=UPI003340DBA4
MTPAWVNPTGMIGKYSAARAKDMLRVGPAWASAVLATTAVSSMIHSWQTQGDLISLGTGSPPGAALRGAALRGAASEILPVLLVLGVALSLAFWAAGWLRARLPLLAPVAWPAAGAVAACCTLGLMSAQLRTTSVTGAVGADGFVMFCLAGALGGFVFSWLKPE